MQTQKINWTFRKIKGSLTTWSHQILEFNHLNPWGFPLKKPTHPKKPQWFFPPEGPTCTKTCVQTRLVPRDRVHEPACKWTSMNSYCLFLWLYMSWQKNKWTHQVQRYNYAVYTYEYIAFWGVYIFLYTLPIPPCTGSKQIHSWNSPSKEQTKTICGRRITFLTPPTCIFSSSSIIRIFVLFWGAMGRVWGGYILICSWSIWWNCQQSHPLNPTGRLPHFHQTCFSGPCLGGFRGQ